MAKTVVVKMYSSEKKFQRDANRMKKKGYDIKSVDRKKKRGCGEMGCKILLFLPLVFFGGKEFIVVTYEKI